MQGRRLTGREAQLSPGHRGLFARLGIALLLQLGGALAVREGILRLVVAVAPRWLDSMVFLGLLSAVTSYGIGLLLFWAVIRGVPGAPMPERPRYLPPLRFVQVFFVAMALLYLSNFITLAGLNVIGFLRGTPVINPVNALGAYPLGIKLLLTCVLAPLVEELIFRRMLLRRMQPYGEKFAVLASALCFALFHGNLNQMLYAFALGVVFGCIAVKCGGIAQVILLHAMVNFVGSCLAPLLNERGSLLMGALVWVLILCGAICFPGLARKVRFSGAGYAMTEGQKWNLFLLNPGMLGFCLLVAFLAASYFGF